ncbi:serpin family protein [Cellulomonas sp. DKR-3]|uniref:Serpin family protein n=1 Tax=Cellulomonas fulva TaxID=2835530 RepID=A0ABS5U0I0_9CELL|nr:serpin family protein [Cellulomonas fulva]MBT0994913.1 serpin family protein [Cellulomonas fulva]
MTARRAAPARWAAPAVLVALAGCAGAPSGDEPAPAVEFEQLALEDAAAVDGVVAATWRLGVEALRTGEEPASAIVSPSSLVTALAMLAEGAPPAAAGPLDDALGAAGQERTDAVNALQGALARYGGDPAVLQDDELPRVPMVHAAQQVVVDDDHELVPDFLDRLRAGYGAGVLRTDLGSSAGIDDLSDWVRQHTGGLVEKSGIVPDAALVAVLQDAIALAAAWEQPFDAALTSDETFHVAGDEPVTVPTMRGMPETVVVEQDGWQAVRLPYTDDLAADVLLPPAGSAAAADPATADAGALAELSAALDEATPSLVAVRMPVIDLATKLDLLPLLGELGITGVPYEVVTSGPAHLGQAVQQAVLQVDEAGTRAAAVTELGLLESAGPRPEHEVVVDRPFLVVVRDGTTEWPLFLAAVLDPRG